MGLTLLGHAPLFGCVTGSTLKRSTLQSALNSPHGLDTAIITCGTLTESIAKVNVPADQ